MVVDQLMDVSESAEQLFGITEEGVIAMGTGNRSAAGNLADGVNKSAATGRAINEELRRSLMQDDGQIKIPPRLNVGDEHDCQNSVGRSSPKHLA